MRGPVAVGCWGGGEEMFGGSCPRQRVASWPGERFPSSLPVKKEAMRVDGSKGNPSLCLSKRGAAWETWTFTHPFCCLVEIPPGYPFQSLPPSFGRHYPYLLQPTAASDADGLAPDVPLPAEGSEHMELSPEVKPIHLSPSKMLEPIQAAAEEESLEERVKSEVQMEESQEGICEQDMGALNIAAASAAVPVQNVDNCNLLLHQGEALGAMEQDQEDLQSCPPPYQVVACPAEAEAPAETGSGAESCSVHMDYDGSLVHAETEPPEMDLTPQREEASVAMDLQGADVPCGREFPSLPPEEGEQGPEIPSYTDEAISCQMPALDIKPGDPLAGMNALVAATEMPQACSLLPAASVAPSQVKLEVLPEQALEHSFLQGITLLSEIAEMELEKRKQEMQSKWWERRLAMGCPWHPRPRSKERCPRILVLWRELESGFWCSGPRCTRLLDCPPLPKALSVSRQLAVRGAEREPHLLGAARVTPCWQAPRLQPVGVWHGRPQ